MSEEKLQYEVGKDGVVIRVRGYKETPAYNLSIGEPVKELSLPSRDSYNRWSALQREVCHLPADNLWRPIPADPGKFPDVAELRRARSSLQKRGKFIEDMLGRKVIQTRLDSANLRVWVRVIEPREAQDET